MSAVAEAPITYTCPDCKRTMPNGVDAWAHWMARGGHCDQDDDADEASP